LLIELLIVVAIILIIAAIAIPNLLRARIEANESSAVVSIRTINHGFLQLCLPDSGLRCEPHGAGRQLHGVAHTDYGIGCLIDSTLATGTKSGYSFKMAGSGGPPSGTYYAANPLTQNTTGVKSFCSAPDAVIRYTTAALTTCAGTETPLQ